MYELIEYFFSYKIHFNKWKNLEIQILPGKKLEDVIKKFVLYLEETLYCKVNMSTKYHKENFWLAFSCSSLFYAYKYTFISDFLQVRGDGRYAAART